ncbi:MAG: TetR/AcrR family transcriptional regulator [Myxococcota bacterium]
MGRQTLTNEEVKAFRDAACEAVMQMLLNREKVSLRLLAKRMGCSHATPYRYFQNKEALLMASRAKCFQRFTDFLREQLQGVELPIERIGILCHSYSDYAHTHRTEFLFMFEWVHPEKGSWDLSEDGLAAWEVVESTVEQAIQKGALKGDVNAVAHQFWAAIHGVVMLSLSNRLQLGISTAKLLKDIANALLLAHGG